MLPQEFKELYEDKSYSWYVIRENEKKEVLFVHKTRMLNGAYDLDDIVVGIPESKYSFVYRKIVSMVYHPDVEIYKFGYFTIRVDTGDEYTLIGVTEESNITKEVKKDVITHVITGLKGDKGEPGKSSYDIWYEKYQNASREEFIDAINASVNAGKYLATKDDYEKRISYLESQLNGYQDAFKQMWLVMSREIPVGALMYSLVRPQYGYWLPFGDGSVYLDEDYPELAKVLKAVSSTFVVDDSRFTVSNVAKENRYLFMSGGNRPTGTIVDSQLPNLTGTDHQTGSKDGWATGVFSKWKNNSKETNGQNNGHGLTFDASRVSSIYKNDVTQVFGDSIAMSIWIKAKHAVLDTRWTDVDELLK